MITAMMREFLDALGQTCGTEVWMPRQQEDSYYRMALLAQCVMTTPSHLRYLRDREQLRLSSCPACGTAYTSSIRSSHTETCSYRLLRFRTQPQHTLRIRHYLQRQWRQTKTDVALEMGYHPCHVVMAYMQQYPDGRYCHAGALVEALLEVEESRAPTWDVTEMIAWFLLSPPTAATRAAPPKCTMPSVTTPHPPIPSTTISTAQGATAATPPFTENAESRKQKLVNEAFELTLPTRCKVCYRAEANALIMDCGHVFVCDRCIKAQDKCPICMGRITEVVRVYRA